MVPTLAFMPLGIHATGMYARVGTISYMVSLLERIHPAVMQGPLHVFSNAHPIVEC
jgi:hypothetical protein